ncbi:MAG: hypothetical protein U1E05_17640 [Patescibacteria group bacterium]|nr:hypothetical protein [Patescibacteria group bacterium]
MPLREPTAASLVFEKEMARLRENIAQLGHHFRPQLQSFADQIERHQESMESECATMHDVVDDMRLREASVKFNLWAVKAL